MDDSKGRAYELQQAAVKCMRGILFCYMRQADKARLISNEQLFIVSHYSLSYQNYCACPILSCQSLICTLTH